MNGKLCARLSMICTRQNILLEDLPAYFTSILCCGARTSRRRSHRVEACCPSDFAGVNGLHQASGMYLTARYSRLTLNLGFLVTWHRGDLSNSQQYIDDGGMYEYLSAGISSTCVTGSSYTLLRVEVRRGWYIVV